MKEDDHHDHERTPCPDDEIKRKNDAAWSKYTKQSRPIGQAEPDEWVRMRALRPAKPAARAEINGDVRTLVEWAELTGVQYRTIKYRYDRGVRGEDLIKKGWKQDK